MELHPLELIESPTTIRIPITLSDPDGLRLVQLLHKRGIGGSHESSLGGCQKVVHGTRSTIEFMSLTDITAGVRLAGVGNLRTELLSGSGDAVYTVRIRNTGDTSDTIDLTTSGTVATLSRSSVSLAPGASTDVTLTISENVLTEVGDYAVTVTATSQTDNRQTASVTTVTTVTPTVIIRDDDTANVALQEGLIGYWTFDEGTGTTAADASGNGNDLRSFGAAGWSSAAGAKIGASAFQNSTGKRGLLGQGMVTSSTD